MTLEMSLTKHVYCSYKTRNEQCQSNCSKWLLVHECFATIQLFRLLHSAGTSPRAHQPLL